MLEMLQCESQVISQITLKLYNTSRTLWSSDTCVPSAPSSKLNLGFESCEHF